MARSRSFTVRLSGSATTIVPSAAAPPVPEGPEELAFADFVNGVYRIGGATVALDDMFVENSDFGSFNPEIPEEGLNTSPVLALALNADLISGFTAVGEAGLNDAASSGRSIIETVDLPDWNSANEARIAYNNAGAGGTYKFSEVIAYESAVQQTAETGLGPWRFAVTILPQSVALSVAGKPVITDTTTDTTVLNTIGIVYAGAFLRNITFHPPQPDAALPGLSAP